MTDERRFENALVKIAARASGGCIEPGTPAYDRHEMIHEARTALQAKYGMDWRARVLAGELP